MSVLSGSMVVVSAVSYAPFIATTVAGEASWPSLFFLSLLGGFLALDDTALAQTWFSQPLAAGALAGIFCGDPAAGLAVGLLVQLVKVGDLPVGQSFTGEPAVPVVAAIGGVVLGGHRLALPFQNASLDSVALTGWVVLGVGLLSAVGHWIVQAERRAHVLWMLQGHLTLRDGALGRIERLHFRCLASTFLRGFIFCSLFLLLFLRLWVPAFEYLPVRARDAMAMLPLILPGLGIGALVDRFGLGNCWHWLTGGAVLSFALSRFLL
ncbi:MAG: PTS sugar transporter subunit IIC [Gemmatimonadales bacterium]|nr:PTS sugar transporter subunit IIC [Gemmatimonadales bacterium]